MRVQIEMGVSADDLFDSIVTSVLYDAERARGKKVPIKKLKAGFSYQKTLNAKLGGARRVTTKITDFDPPRLYAASVTSSSGVNTVRYEIEPIEGADAIRVRYEEGYEGARPLDDLNGKLMASLYSPFAKRKVKARLRAMESYIQRHAATPAARGAERSLGRATGDAQDSAARNEG